MTVYNMRHKRFSMQNAIESHIIMSNTNVKIQSYEIVLSMH